MPKKVLFLENAIGWGGAAICLKLIAEYLNKNKYYPIITTPHNDKYYMKYSDVSTWYHISNKKIDKSKIAKNIQIPFNKIRIKNQKYIDSISSLIDYSFNIFPYINKLYSVIKKEKIDIIHLNNEPVCNMGGVIVANLLKIPCISHIRGGISWNSWISKWLYRNVDFIITVADWLKKDIIDLGVPEYKIRTIWDGRKLHEFSKSFNVEETRRSLGLQPGQLSVAMIGRLNPWKGHSVFIEAAKVIENQFPQSKILIIGGASDTYKQYEIELKKLAHKKEIKNLVFTGQRDDIANVMRVIDIIVHASVDPDPYPNVVLEGMAAGKAVIATNIGGPLEMLEDYETGMLVPPNEPKILVDRIGVLLSKKELRLSIGNKAKKVAFERYSVENHVRQIEQVYEEILSTYKAN